MGLPTIAAVMNTLNEEARLPFSLGSVKPWVDEIVVVDMHSDDRTVAVAESFGARVAGHDRVGYADPARAMAISMATTDWILVLDADEMVPPSLARRLMAIAARDEADVVRIPMVNHLLGAPLRATGWGPDQDRHLRFFRRGAVTATSDIHDYLHVEPRARVLDLAPTAELSLIHFNYIDVSHFLDKLNRYTSIEAGQALAGARRASRAGAVVSAGREFLRRYLKARGYRDGWRGFYLAWLMAGYRLVASAKLKELQETGGRDAVERRYRSLAEGVLADYASFGASDAGGASDGAERVAGSTAAPTGAPATGAPNAAARPQDQ
jgi:glycosyltransferase involved in cell wall biosynthesis